MSSLPPLLIWKNGVKIATVLGKVIKINENVFQCEVSDFIHEGDGYEIYPDVFGERKMSILWNGCEYTDSVFSFRFVKTGYSGTA